MPRGTAVPLMSVDGGVRTNLPTHRIPPGFLKDARNVIGHDGRLTVRPGYDEMDAVTFPDRINGLFRYLKEDGSTHELVAGHRSGLRRWTGTTWSDITESGNVLTAGSAAHTRFAVYFEDGKNKLIVVNDTDAPKVWDGTASTYSDLGGSPPIAKIVEVAERQILLGNITIGGQRKASGIQISDVNNSESGYGTNEITTFEEPSAIVEMMKIGQALVGVYKHQSLYVLVGIDAVPTWKPEFVAEISGPASPACLVNARGVHYWLAQDGQIYRFAGGGLPEAVGDAIHGHILETRNTDAMGLAHGVFFADREEIWWFYPGIGESEPKSFVVYSLPTQSWWPGNVFHPMTASVFSGQSINDGLYYPVLSVASDSSRIFRLGSVVPDDGNAVDYSWEYPDAVGENIGQAVIIDVVDSFFKRASASYTVNIQVGVSPTIAQPLSYSVKEPIDIRDITQSDFRTSWNKKGRFWSLRYSGSTTTERVEYRGSVVYVHTEDIG